jgi:hypothetical protein
VLVPQHRRWRDINAVEITGNTYYPDEDRTNLYMRNWQDPDSEARLMIQPRDDVYPGCRVQIKIAAH